MEDDVLITVELLIPSPERRIPGFSFDAARSAFEVFVRDALALFGETAEVVLIYGVDEKQTHPFCACVMEASDSDRRTAALLYRSIVTMGGLVAASFTLEACDDLEDQKAAQLRLTPEMVGRIYELTSKFRDESTVNSGLIFD